MDFLGRTSEAVRIDLESSTGRDWFEWTLLKLARVTSIRLYPQDATIQRIFINNKPQPIPDAESSSALGLPANCVQFANLDKLHPPKTVIRIDVASEPRTSLVAILDYLWFAE